MYYGELPSLLLVEDSLDDEMMSLRGISKSGIRCNVIVRRDGAEALTHLLDDSEPSPSLVLLDYMLPKLNGLEVLTGMRSCEKTRTVPVVIFSGSNAGSALAECYRYGANSCVTKPNDASDYIERLAWIVRYWLTMNELTDSRPLLRAPG